MFHVEQSMIKLIFLIFSTFLVMTACSKPNPTPEVLDPIYLDISKELSSTQAELEREKKTLDEQIKELKKVQPQTGQVKYAQKRVDDTVHKMDHLKQMITYLEIRLESRKSESRSSYIQAYNSKAVWPDPNELVKYQAQKRLENAPKEWNAKQRIHDSLLGIQDKPKKEPGGH
jgi:hypothetical protein